MMHMTGTILLDSFEFLALHKNEALLRVTNMPKQDDQNSFTDSSGWEQNEILFRMSSYLSSQEVDLHGISIVFIRLT